MADNTVKLKLAPGFYRNGTPYQSAGRWMSGDLVRWHNDSIKPINGWLKKADFASTVEIGPLWDTSGEAARTLGAVGDTIGGVNSYVGTNKKIYQLAATNTVSDVTPEDFVAKPQHTSPGNGYGLFRYSYGSYGNQRPSSANPIPIVFSWGFTSWGVWPVMVARGDPALKVLIKTDTDDTFVEIPNAPSGANDVLVTDERFMMTFGIPEDGKLIKWSNQEDYNQWTPAINNQAGDLRLAGTGHLLRAVRCLKRILVLGDNDAFAGQYVGPPYIYGFDRIGEKCGIIGPNAVVVTDTFAAWIGSRSFWIYDGVVRQLPCDVLDYYLADRNDKQQSKTCAFTVSDYSECWWLYQSRTSTTNEVDSYIIYNYAQKIWYTGRLDRTVGMDKDPSRSVAMVSADGNVYDHELVNAPRDGRIPVVRSGPLELDNGERMLGCSWVFPDDILRGAVKMDLQVRDIAPPGGAGSALLYTRTFDLLMPTSTHGIMGRDIRMVLYGTEDKGDWMVGDFRVVPIKAAGPMR